MKKVLTATVIVLSTLLTVGCTSNTDTTKDDKTFSLNDNIKISQQPEWDIEKTVFPDNWKVGEEITNPDGGIVFDGAKTSSALLGHNNDNTCFISGLIYESPKEYAGRGTFWISKTELYKIGETTQKKTVNEKTVNIKSNKGAITFTTGETNVIQNSYYNFSENIESTNNSLKTIATVRSFDTEKNVDQPIPTVAFLYSCVNPEDVDAEENKALIDSLYLTVK